MPIDSAPPGRQLVPSHQHPHHHHGARKAPRPRPSSPPLAPASGNSPKPRDHQRRDRQQAHRHSGDQHQQRSQQLVDNTNPQGHGGAELCGPADSYDQLDFSSKSFWTRIACLVRIVHQLPATALPPVNQMGLDLI